MDTFFIAYIAAWGAACLGAAALYFRRPADFSISLPGYRRFLFVRWKIATFLIAGAGLTLIAPYTGDPTWDYIDASFQSVLTFLGAPWVVGAIYLALRGTYGWKQLYFAVCLWLFSACWSYDLYILLRDGRYPDTWLVNIAASSVLYIAGGLLWSLDWRAGRGVTFSFLEPGWPEVSAHPAFTRVLGYALPFMLIAAASAGYFVVSSQRG